MLAPGCRKKFIDCEEAEVHIVVHPIIDVETRWNSTLALLEHAYLLQEFTCESLQNPHCIEYWPCFTTQDEWTIIEYVMEVFRQF
jgi:hypothetical protein